VAPQRYTGRSMSESHKHLKITESEWAAFCKDFDDTMAKFNVPEAEHKELFAIVESTKGDIVSARARGARCGEIRSVGNP
jgi:hemoglobin